MFAGSDGLKLVPSQPTVLCCAVVVAVDIVMRVSADATAVTGD